MFRKIRIAILLYVLLFVAAGGWVTRSVSTDWERTLWVAVHPINADGDAATQDYIDRLRRDDFADVIEFFERETRRYGAGGREPLHVELAPQIGSKPEPAPSGGSWPAIAWWSLKLRFWVWEQTRDLDLPTPDVRIFMNFHQPRDGLVLEPSVGLRKGMTGIVNAFASRHLAGPNQLILAHELLHTLGATDKYDPATGYPLFPAGFGDPAQSPLLPQRWAEVMGGRRALTGTDAEIPRSLDRVLIGPDTAREIRLSAGD